MKLKKSEIAWLIFDALLLIYAAYNFTNNDYDFIDFLCVILPFWTIYDIYSRIKKEKIK